MAFVNPLQKRRCPACGSEFFPGNCAIVSSVTSGKVLQPEQPGFLHRVWLKPINGPVLTKEFASRQCPDCKVLLPNNIERAQSYTIAIVGDSASGKSHFIASCINELKTKSALQVIGCRRIIAQQGSDTHYYRDYYKPVYVDHQQISATQRGRKIIEPLIYELVFSEQSPLLPARSINLLFYDSSGEDIVEQINMVQYSAYILNASAIIFLADPLTMPGIVKQLPSNLRPTVLRERRSSEVLNRVAQTFEMSHRLTSGKKLKIPIAVTISKSDILKYVTKYDAQTPLFLRPSNYANMLDSKQFKIVSDEVQKLLQRVGDDVLVYSSDLFENVSFFAVSATGWPPDAKGKFPSIEALRCLDPLLWVLWKLDIMEAR